MNKPPDTSAPSLPPKPSLLGRAVIGKGTAWGITIPFLVMLLIPPIYQCLYEIRTTGRWRVTNLFKQLPDQTSLKLFEDDMETESILGREMRKRYREFLLQFSAQGLGKLVLGRDGFLFYRTDVEFAYSPGFLSHQSQPHRRINERSSSPRPASDPVQVIVDFKRQLLARGINLLLVPIPAKSVIYPERVWPGYSESSGPAWNCDYRTFLQKLRDSEVDVLDLSEDFWRAKSSGVLLFLKQDTHWSPEGIKVAIRCIADHVKRSDFSHQLTGLTSRRKSVENYGDLLRLLDDNPEIFSFPRENVVINQVLEDGQFVKGGADAPILLLGDSFSNVYSQPSLHWGEGAGLGEQLMKELGVHVQIVAQNGGGATIARETLARMPEALRSKKVVIWAFTSRDLFDDDILWEKVPLPEIQH